MKHRKNPQSAIRNPQSFWRDERGQGIVFAAASLVMLVGFVALVYNIGHVTERRTKVQVAADASVYSGSVVEANALSTIGWLNSAMAQVYYNSIKYAVDVNVTGVAAAMELKQDPEDENPDGPALRAYNDAYNRALRNMRNAKRCLRDLSRIQHCIAILTPRLVEEEMFAVGARAGTVGNVRGAERLSLFPSFRLYPLRGGVTSYRIEQLEDGWRVSPIPGDGRMLQVKLVGREWHLQYCLDGIVQQEVIISEESENRWRVRYYQPPGNLVQEVIIVRTGSIGWVVWGSQTGEGGGMEELPEIRFEDVDMVEPCPEPEDPEEERDTSLDWTAGNEGTRITYEGESQVFAQGPNHVLYKWDPDEEEYVPFSSNETVIGGVTVNLNVSNVIHFPHATVRMGNPVRVTIGQSPFVTELTLSDPPRISTHFGPVHIAIRGFDEDDFGISVGGFSLTTGQADGAWRKHYNRHEEFWWQHRLTEQVPEEDDAERQWQYDTMVIGAHMEHETNRDRFVMQHAIGDRWGSALPPWCAWFDPIGRAPRDPYWRHHDDHYGPPDPLTEIRTLKPEHQPPSNAYFLTRPCGKCEGIGRITCPVCNGVDHDEDGFTDVGDAPPYTRCAECDGTGKVVCPVCNGLDHDPDIPGTDVRVFIADVLPLAGTAGLDESDYLDARIYSARSYGGGSDSAAKMPLVLATEFFQFGMNVGAWRPPSSPMLFPDSREPDWGFAAIASARVGIPDDEADGGYQYQFDDRESREAWCDDSPANLYGAGVRPRFWPSRYQVKEYDLERENILVGTSVRGARETPITYLWDAILGAGHVSDHNNWLGEYDGQADYNVGQYLRNMRNRRGSRFDFRSPDLDEVVEH